MRLLALRGANLASLRQFELDLSGAPLGHVGLFAITGPTGAGKSTLLDALCLALYDRTPRLGEQRGGAPIGRRGDGNRLYAHDVRGILRRGAGEGFAEVDFVGADGGRYRARWSVHRAYSKSDGRFQSQSLELEDLDADAVRTGKGKTETLERIEAAVGLNFDQFRRSVLLAQGEFDAFLKAEVKRRGALLERMTGTEIYRDLSIAAHRQAAQAGGALGEFEREVEAAGVLPDAVRIALDARLAEAGAWIEAAEARVDRLTEAERWYGARRQRIEAEQAAQAELSRAEAAWAEAEPLHRQVDAARAAEPLRGALRRADAAAEVERGAARAAAERETASRVAEAAAVAARATRSEAQARFVAARGRREAARPDLERARDLDHERARLERAVGEAEAAHARTLADAAAAAEALAAVGREVARLEADARRAEVWLAENPEVHGLAAQWPRWKAELDRYAEARAALGRLDASRRSCVAEVLRAVWALERARSAARRAAAAGEAARAEVGRRQSKARAQPTATLQAEVERCTRLHGLLSNLRERARDARRYAAELERAQTSREEAKAAERRARRRARDAGKRAEEARVQADEADKALRLTRGALDLAEHRARLVDGEPCPLCGATEHPGIEVGAALVDAHQTRVDALRARHREQSEARAAADAEARGEAGRVAEADARIDSRRLALAEQRGEWEIVRLSLGDAEVPEDPLDPAVESAIRADLERVLEQREAASRHLRAAKALHAAVEAARAAADVAGNRLDAARRAEASALVRARDAEDALEDLGTEAEHHLAAGEAALSALDQAFAPGVPWRERLAADPSAFGADCARAVRAWNQQRQALEAADEALEAERPRLEVLRERAAHTGAARVEAEAKARTARAAAAAVVERRAALFDGRPTAAVEAELEEAERVAEAAREAAQSAASKADAEAAAAAGRAEDARLALERARAERADADAHLVQTLTEHGLDRATLKARLVHGPAWIHAQTETLNALRTEVRTTAAVLDQRRADRRRHADEAPTVVAEVCEETLPTRLAEARAVVGAFHQTRAIDEAARAQDDQARAARGRLEPERARLEEAARTWRQLDALIGAADGAPFREFAQSLTLDAVIGHANQHLRALARRYRLMRVPGHDLELQVLDRDLGDEIRSVQSLSGGESFLVSLALALGLASLSARDARIESLFIDEGFGSLDSETLDVVLSTLDTLQATGRQIGLISHVPGLAERIGVQVQVVPEAAGVSRVRVRAPTG